MNHKIVLSFVYPKVGLKLGGAELLYARLIKYISENMNNIIVRLYDYDDGSIRLILKMLNASNYEFIELPHKTYIINNLGNEVFIVSPIIMAKILNSLKRKKNVKFLFWDLLYSVWENLFKVRIWQLVSYELPKLKKKIINIMVNNNGFVTVPEGKDYFKNQIDVATSEIPILGIPINGIDNKYKKEKRSELRITYLGRSEFWKVTPVRKLLKDLQMLRFKYRINIITDNIYEFKKHLNELCFDGVISFKENLFGEKLTDYLLTNTDIGFGMGTSAIEFAKLGIPTILADFAYNEFPDNYRYQWLYENNGNGLGLNVELNGWNGNKCLDDILNEYKEDIYDNIGKKCFDYVVMNNDFAVLANKLIDLSYSTKLTYEKINCCFFRLKYLKILIKGLVLKSGRPLA